MDFKKLVKERRSIKHFDAEHSMHKMRLGNYLNSPCYRLRHLICSIGDSLWLKIKI